MAEDTTFYTATMAKVYADQGDMDKAEKIYRYILEQEPGREDIIKAIAEIEKEKKRSAPKNLALLFDRWIKLALEYNNLKKLKKLRD